MYLAMALICQSVVNKWPKITILRMLTENTNLVAFDFDNSHTKEMYKMHNKNRDITQRVR